MEQEIIDGSDAARRVDIPYHPTEYRATLERMWAETKGVGGVACNMIRDDVLRDWCAKNGVPYRYRLTEADGRMLVRVGALVSLLTREA